MEKQPWVRINQKNFKKIKWNFDTVGREGPWAELGRRDVLRLGEISRTLQVELQVYDKRHGSNLLFFFYEYLSVLAMCCNLSLPQTNPFW